eukprot:PITA_12603
MIPKLDLSKAFDKLSWEYIHQMLLAFGFNATWTRWIMNLITSPCFSVLLNGSPSMPFRPSRVTTQKNIARILGFSIAALPSKYLGAPLLDSAIKHASWRTLLDKLEARLSSWTFRSLNIASRLILIKSVLQAMPLSLFSILAAPKWVLKAIRNLQRSFLWGSTALNRKWALFNWKEVCQPKSNGGIGLRDPLQSNNTMGARIWWNWIAKPHIPWTRLWQEKYVPGSQWDDLIRISPTIPRSMIWNAAKLHSAFIQEHSFWEIHSGTTTRF